MPVPDPSHASRPSAPSNPGGFPGDDKRRVLEATDLVRLIGEHVALKRKGREWACLCPFHDDHNPSMYVVPHKQIYHCFVCGAGGDAISFVMNYHKTGFREALQLLADRAGIPLSPPPRRRAAGEGGGGVGGVGGAGSSGQGDAEDSPGISRDSLLSANRTAQSFFRAILAHAEHGKAAREVLARRGVTPEMIERFGLGASPDRWDGLVATLAGKAIDTAPFLAAGLLKARDSGAGVYDAMRHRLTFPIHDALGRVIAFGGRRLNDADEPKYLNSPETLLFNKSATLYGLPFAAASIRERNEVIVTEGYMDCLACHQAGVTNVVATLGTALTALGARVLRRLCDRVVLLFDGDDAGQRAADRAIEVLFAEPIDVRIAVMSAAPPEPGQPAPKDPDELLGQPRGRERFEAMIAGSVEALEHRFARLAARLAGQTLAGRARLIEEEIARLADLGLGRVSPVRRQMIVRRVATLAGVAESVVSEAVLRQAPRVRSETVAAATEPTGPRRFADLGPREQVMACVLCDSTLLEELTAEERATLLAVDDRGEDDPSNAVAGAVARLAGEGRAFGVREVSGLLNDPIATRLATLMSAAVDQETEEHRERRESTWRDCLTRWRRTLAEVAAPPPGDGLAMALHRVKMYQRFGPDPTRMPGRSR